MTDMEPTCIVFPVDMSEFPAVPQFVPYKGSTKVKCSRCQRECWLGPSQKKMSETFKMPCICAICLTIERGSEVLDSMIPLTNKRMGE